MSEPNPVDNPELYEAAYIGGVPTPGKVWFQGHDRPINWDVKKSKGQSGASMELNSEDPREFTMNLYLVDSTDFDAWPALRDALLSTISGSTPKALDIYHPDLVEVNIKSIVLSNLGGVAHDGKGGQTRAIKLHEYAPPKKKGGSPKGSSSTSRTKTKREDLDPNAKALAELAALTQQYRDTPWG